MIEKTFQGVGESFCSPRQHLETIWKDFTKIEEKVFSSFFRHFSNFFWQLSSFCSGFTAKPDVMRYIKCDILKTRSHIEILSPHICRYGYPLLTRVFSVSYDTIWETSRILNWRHISMFFISDSTHSSQKMVELRKCIFKAEISTIFFCFKFDFEVHKWSKKRFRVSENHSVAPDNI